MKTMSRKRMAIYATGCLCCLSLAGTSCATGEEPVYDNPLRTSAGDTVRLADPFVYESDGLYYMTGTTASAEASGFDYYVSSDLVAWEYGGPLFRKSSADFGAGAFWAPEVERYEGRFYMTYSCLEPERGVLLSCLAVSDRPEGPFEELYTPWFDLGFSAIDCDIFVDDDPQHTPYLYFSKNGNRDGYAFGENWVVTRVVYEAQIARADGREDQHHRHYGQQRLPALYHCCFISFHSNQTDLRKAAQITASSYQLSERRRLRFSLR